MWNHQIMGFDIYFLFYNFFLYCFFGWIYESGLVSLQKRTWVNRGFLNGPIIPIYGAGATVVYVLLSPIQNHPSWVFVGGMLIATVLEYITSYIMEKLFHAKWWDYSNYKYNIQGRICLMASLFWGFLSIFMTDVLQPVINGMIKRIPRQAGETAGAFICILFAADVTVTVIYTLKLDKKFADMSKIREEISEYLEGTRLYETKEEFMEWLDERSFFSIPDNLREQFEIKKEQLGHSIKAVNRDELEAGIKGFLARYQKSAELKSIVQKRLIKAFPTMKTTRGQSGGILDDLRKKRK